MSDATKAVFLSYASQDAEAAKRICDALRAAGVEVWFDQSELVGGDQWDQKIRGQIGSCALFVPIISAATQARGEGYFRLEWKLAVDRSHLMAHDQPFLLPVVIDATADAAARVPPEFRIVQWTKLVGGETPPAFCARVRKLLGGEAGPVSDRPSGSSAPSVAGQRPALPRKRPLWLIPVIVALAIAAGVWQQKRNSEKPAASIPAPAAPAAPSTLSPSNGQSEARQLAEKAMRTGGGSAGMLAAADLAEKATHLDATDAEVWALAALVDIRCWVNADRTEQRAEMARTKVMRAKGLAPRSIIVRFAEARMLTELELYPDGGAKAESILRELRQENTDERIGVEITGVLGLAVGKQGRGPEAARLLEEAGRTDPNWMRAASWRYLQAGMLPEALRAARQNTEMQRTDGLIMQMVVQEIREDLDAVRDLLGQFPESERIEELPASAMVLVSSYKREPEQMLAAAKLLPGDYQQNQFLDAPKAASLAMAYTLAGRNEAAQLHWKTALAVVDARLATRGSDPDFLGTRLFVLAKLGRQEEAEQDYRLLKELLGPQAYFDEAFNLAALGRKEEALAALTEALRRKSNLFGHLTARYNPTFDLLRGDPRFEKLLRETLPPDAKPFDDTQGRPIDDAQGRPIDDAQGRPIDKAKPSSSAKATEDRSGLPATPDLKSVAVLAFANLSDDKANEYFSDGISEELLNVLAKIPGLKVTARTSSFHFKGKDTPIPEIAQQLGVAYVIEGSVRKQGDKVRITAQLIKAADGFHVWSDTFTREMKDIFAVQDEIAGLIARNLELKIGMAPTGAAIVEPEAYQHLLRARFFSARSDNEGRLKSIEECKAALAIDPNFALAAAEMARAYIHLARFSGMGLQEAFAAARPAAEMALRLNPELPDVQNAMGWVQRTADWDWQRADASFRRAYELAPQSAPIIADYAVMRNNLGHLDEAIALGRRAVELDPLNATTHAYLSLFLGWKRQFGEAELEARRSVELNPGAVEWNAYLSRWQLLQGRWAEASAAAEAETGERYRLFARALVLVAQNNRPESDRLIADLIRRYGEREAAYVAEYYALAGESDLAFAWLERARSHRETFLVWFKALPTLQALRSDPRWVEFLRKIGLADDQLK